MARKLIAGNWKMNGLAAAGVVAGGSEPEQGLLGPAQELEPRGRRLGSFADVAQAQLTVAVDQGVGHDLLRQKGEAEITLEGQAVEVLVVALGAGQQEVLAIRTEAIDWHIDPAKALGTHRLDVRDRRRAEAPLEAPTTKNQETRIRIVAVAM